MTEIFFIIMPLSAILSTYALAWARGLKVLNLLQAERISELKKENGDLWAKVLAKSGNSPLGWENKPKPDKTPDATTKPTVAHRGMLEARAQQTEETPPQTNIYADRTSFSRVKREAVEKAGEIINATK